MAQVIDPASEVEAEMAGAATAGLAFEELMRYKEEQKQRSANALKRLSDLSKELGEEL